MKPALILLALAFLHTCSTFPIRHPSNWLTHCRASTNLSALEVLPGGGWDNLRNMDMGRVMNLSYFECQSTEDGQYLIPDEVFVIPKKETGVETNSEIISSWSEQKSVTSQTVNVDANFFSVLNGKYSAENMRIKTHQVKDSTKTTRVQVRNVIYIVKAYTDFTLDSRFAQQAKDIADAIENNQTKNAAYLSEKMVVDFGTHVITSVDAGATLVEEDYLSSTYVSDNSSQTSSVKTEAGLNFFDKLKFDIGGGSSQQSSTLKTYQSNIQYSIIQSHGGVPFYPGITLSKWQESTRNNLVAIDRSGVPLHYIINHNTLQDLPQPTVEKVAQSVKQAIQRYYEVNTRPGCVDVNSKNFNFQANVDDASCEGPATNLSFGGVYQQCEYLTSDEGKLCENQDQKNPDTGDFSCRSPFTPTLLRSELKQEVYYLYECKFFYYACVPECKWWTIYCADFPHTRSALINTYWCSVNGKAPDNSGYLFGGLYSPSVLNPITNSKSCPSNFIPLKFLSDGMMICISHDYEIDSKNAVPFGGFFSCESTNPLANGQRRCPPKFSQHLATVNDGCEILYCVQSGLFTGGELKPIRLPPFTKLPVVSMKANDTVMVVSNGEKKWWRRGEAKLAKPEQIQEMVTANHEYNQISSWGKTGIAFGALALVALVALLIVKKRRRLPKFQMNKSYEEIKCDVEESEKLMQQ